MRGRTPVTTQPVNLPVANEEAVEASLKAAEQLSITVRQQDARVRAVAEQIGYQLPADATDPDLIARDIAANMRRTVEACMEIGRGLIVLGEACPHGEFGIHLDALKIDRTLAKRFMMAARKFSKGASTHLLAAAGNQTKLLELLVLDDEQIEELSLTGQTGELALDDVARMSTSELRAALRKAKREKEEEAEAARRIREARDTTINRLQADNDRLQRELAGKPAAEVAEPTPAMREATALEALNRCALALVNEVDVSLRKQLVAVQNLFGEELPPNHATLAMQQAITQVIQAARVVAADHGIVLPLSTETPQELAWLANMEELDTLTPEAAAERMGGGVFVDDTDALAAEGWALLDADETAGGNHVQ